MAMLTVVPPILEALQVPLLLCRSMMSASASTTRLAPTVSVVPPSTTTDRGGPQKARIPMSAKDATAMDIRRPVTLTQLYLLPARAHREACVTTAGTILRARIVNDVSYTISGTDAQELQFRRPVSPVSVTRMGQCQGLPVTQ